jgi:hypothetical protein
LIDKTSSINLYVKLKALASWIFLSFTSFWRNSDSYEHKNKSARRGAQYGCLRWPWICSVYRRHTVTIPFVFPRSKPKMTYYWIFYMSNTTGTNSRTGIAYLCRVPGFVLVYCGILVVESLYFCFLCSVDYCLLVCPEDQWISCPLLSTLFVSFKPFLCNISQFWSTLSA